MKPARRAALAAMLLVSACAAGGSSETGGGAVDELGGTAWLAEDIQGGGVLDRLRTTLSFLADGRVSGTGGCNRYSARLSAFHAA